MNKSLSPSLRALTVWAGIGAIMFPPMAQSAAPLPPGTVGRTAAESSLPAWPTSPAAPAGAPNVLVIMTDDAGFGSSSTFGGPVPTETFDALARDGLRYNRFHTTALCSPTRAALLTGRNPHNVEMGKLINTPTGYEGYTTAIPKTTATIAAILLRNGYNTAMFGKAHITPEWELSQAGPFDRWPTGLGFQHYYGFLGGDTDQFAPTLVEDTTPIDPPYGDPDYILDRDLADRTIRWIRGQREIAPAKPFFVYYAPGSPHSPHQAPREWLDRFRGRFDQGWDVMRERTLQRQKALGVVPADTRLTPRSASLPAWSSLSSDQKRVSARLMEAFAASLAFADHEIGRVIDSLRQSGQLDNTLIIYIQGDNGSSAEGGVNGKMIEQAFVNGYPDDLVYMLRNIDKIGGPELSNNYPAAWAWAMNTPFQYYKQVASHFGGTRNGMVISWPKGIRHPGGVRQQFHYVSDVLPTILEATKVAVPELVDGVRQKPFDGISMAYSFEQATAPSHRRRQVFEMAQNLGIYQDGWWAGTRPAKAPWNLYDGKKVEGPRTWELYHVEKDFSQAHDLATELPKRLAEMQKLFWVEAERNNILPLHDSSEGTRDMPKLGDRKSFLYRSRISRVPENAAPHLVGRSFAITADVVIPAHGGDGVLVAHGGHTGGYAFYVKDGRPTFHYNALEERQYRVAAPNRLEAGAHRLTATFRKDAEGRSGTLTLVADGKTLATGRIEHTLFPWVSYTEDFDVGRDSITPVSNDYTSATSRFAGELVQLRVEIE